MFDLDGERNTEMGQQGRKPKWNITRLNEKSRSIAIRCDRACVASMPRKTDPTGRFRPVYRWSDERAALRRRCVYLRRRIARDRRRHTEVTEIALTEFTRGRRKLLPGGWPTRRFYDPNTNERLRNEKKIKHCSRPTRFQKRALHLQLEMYLCLSKIN